MPSKPFSWLHLTDFHFGLKGQNFIWPNLRQPFLDDLEKLHQQTGPWQAVLFTGDLVQQGKSDEFRGMQQEVLERLWEKLSKLGSGDAILLAVPGNHDLFRPNPKEDNAAIDALLDKDGFNRIATKFWDNSTGAYRRVINDAFAAYSEWWNSTPHRPSNLTTGILPGDFACSIECGNRHIGIVGLNTAFLQLQGGDYQKKLVWDTRQLQAVCGGAIDDWLKNHDICLLLTHQGPDWLTPEAKRHGDSEIAPAGRFALHLFGHMHEANIETIQKIGNSKATWQCQGSSVFGMELFGEPPTLQRSHGYSTGRIEFNQGQASFRLWPRIATDKPDGWRYIPDHNNVHLLDDHGTAPEILNSRALKTTDTNTQPKPTSIPAGAPVPHSTLPSRRPFFGRAKELADIARFIQPDFKGWGVVLGGPGGIGKTSLALEAAHRAPAEHYPLKLFVTAKTTRLRADGVHAVQDNRVDDYFKLLTEIGLALGCDDIQRLTPDRQVARVHHALAAQKVLLVLDNLETFNKEERRRIYDLLEILPSGCRAIVTSRRRDETAARTLRLDKLDVDAALQLLTELGEHTPAIAKLTDSECRQLYSETGGNPLLLTWTAAQLGRSQGRCRTVEAAVQRLQEAHRLQKINEQNDPLAFVYGDLLDSFTVNETAVLAALAYFTEPARLNWLLPLAKLSETAALTALDDLRDRALLLEDEANSTWFLPPLAARFLRQHRPEAINTTGQRLEEEAYALAIQHGGDDNGPYTELKAAWPMVQAALPLLVAGDNARLQKLCGALFRFLDFIGCWDVLLTLHKEGEAKALAAGDHANAGWRAYQAGWIYYLQGKADAVLNCAERCASYWQQAGYGAREQAIAIGLRSLGYQIQEDYPAAIIAYQQELTLWRSLNPESKDVAISLNDLANAKKASGDLDGAMADYHEALRIAHKVSYREGVAYMTGNLAELSLARQDWLTAESLAAEAMILAGSVGRVQLIANNHRRLAQALLNQQRADEALRHAQEAVAIFTTLRHYELAEAEATLAACEAACSQCKPE
jgi:tetratricopeptide (TPR) repeat protein